MAVVPGWLTEGVLLGLRVVDGTVPYFVVMAGKPIVPVPPLDGELMPPPDGGVVDGGDSELEADGWDCDDGCGSNVSGVNILGVGVIGLIGVDGAVLDGGALSVMVAPPVSFRGAAFGSPPLEAVVPPLVGLEAPLLGAVGLPATVPAPDGPRLATPAGAAAPPPNPPLDPSPPVLPLGAGG